MRSIIISLLVLLFSMCGAQTQNTQTEVQTESQSTGAAAATTEVTTQLDVSAELIRLRDTVENLSTTVVELRTTLSFTQTELQNTKSLLYTVQAENDDQDIELAVLKERLVASETKVENLERVNVAQETELTAVKTRLTACETELLNLRKETAAQAERLAVTENDMEYVKNDIAALQTDLTTMKTEVMNLKTEKAAQETRLTASETEVENLKIEIAAVRTRLAATETDVVNLEKKITEQPKVAFSAFLGYSGYMQAGNTDMNLVFTKIITNIGQAYSSTTGFFTAPVRGVYYFRFTVMDILTSRWMNIKMYKNGEQIMYLGEYDTDGNQSYLSSGETLQLEVGDEVNLRLPAGRRLHDDVNNHCNFSGFLLFPLLVEETSQCDTDK